MPLIIPVTVNYQSPLTAFPTRWQNESPPEGPRMIPVEILWGTMGGPNNSISINLQNNQAMNFSQIVALAVDNSACGGDVQFLFPDSNETVTIPAYSPKIVVPVFTNQTQLYVVGSGIQTEDITRFSIHNTLPPPIAVPTTQAQELAVANDIGVSAASGSVQVVAAGVNGSLENAFIGYVIEGTTTGSQMTWQLEDGANNVIAGGTQIGVSAGFVNGTALDLTNVRVRFQNGIKFVWTNGGLTANSFYAVNLYYRTP